MNDDFGVTNSGRSVAEGSQRKALQPALGPRQWVGDAPRIVVALAAVCAGTWLINRPHRG